MKNSFFIVYFVLGFALPISVVAEDVFSHQGVQYKILNQHEVSAIHYDSAYIVIPDSVSYDSKNYAVTDAISQYTSENCSLRHYRKIDLSAATNVTTLRNQNSELIAVDTLILPPNLSYFPTSFSTIDTVTGKPIEDVESLLPGIHRVYSTGTQNYNIYIHSPSLLEADLSTYTCTLQAQSRASFQNNPFLQKLVLPNTIRVFGPYMFDKDCRLTEISVPDSLKQIDYSVFNQVAQTSLTIGPGVEHINSQFAQEWYNLKWMEVDSANHYYMSQNGVLYTKDQTTLFHFPFYREGEEFQLKPNTEIIGSYAFASALSEGIIDKLDPIRSAAPLKKLICQPALREIQPYAFFGSNISEYVGFHESQVETLPHSCFQRSALKTIHLPESLREIGHRAFAETPNLRQLGTTFSQSLQSIGFEAFRDAWSLEELDLFVCRALVDIPQAMCMRDSSLTYVALPRNVQTIGDQAFKGCVSLQEILCPAVDPIPVNYSVFEGVPKWNCVLSVPAGSVEKYKKAAVWKDFYYIQAAPLYYIATDVTDTLTGWVMGGGLYQKGESASVIAIPYDGYEFATWSDGVTTNPRLIHVTQDLSLVAEFVKIPEALETPQNPTPTNGKRIENGQLLIQSGDKVYNAQGQQLK